MAAGQQYLTSAITKGGKEKKSATRITTTSTSILKQDPNTQKVQKNAIYWDKTQPANLWGNNNTLCQATKQHLNNS